VISCEHGGNRVPPEYQKLFKDKQSILQSHRGWDAGAPALAQDLADKLKVPFFCSTVTRLLVDLNRSLHHPHLFSEFTHNCDTELKTEILEAYYYPYRKKLEDEILKILAGGSPVIHLSVHSFTPKLGKEIRRADIGLLFDPQRKGERDLCCNLQAILRKTSDRLIVRRNYPYKGTADGLTTYLRKKYSGEKYLGIEIEINQKHINANRPRWNRLRKQIINSVILAFPP
jgi:Predicted N-formylglutamate amidohydrolase